MSINFLIMGRGGSQCCRFGYGIRIRDPGSGAFLTPGSGMGKKIRIRIRNKQPGSYFRELKNPFFGVKILKFFYADLGWKIFGSGIRYKHPGSTRLVGPPPWSEPHTVGPTIFKQKRIRQMFRIRDVYPGSRIRLFSIPDLNFFYPGSTSKNLNILTQKNFI
jgi:hypothetical protein